MNRRSFLASLAATLTLDPERALWVPGKRLISIPAPASVLVANRILVIDKFVAGALDLLARSPVLQFSTPSALLHQHGSTVIHRIPRVMPVTECRVFIAS